MCRINKILISSILIFASIFTFAGCNEAMGFGTFNFDRAHISVGGVDACVEVESWHDNEIGCELRLVNGTSIYLSEGTYILIDGECPICKK